MSNTQRLKNSRDAWDAEAASFDDAPDHGLRDENVRQAWATLVACLTPPVTGAALDLGCGTGSLSLVLAGLGWNVTGIDLSPAMIDRAGAKAEAAATGPRIQFVVGDAAFPQMPPRTYDLIICRHVLWTLPDPAGVLERWTALLKPGGRLVLVEGSWQTGAGLHSDDVLEMLPATLTNISQMTLSDRPELWGGAVEDERYVITADLLPRSLHGEFPVSE